MSTDTKKKITIGRVELVRFPTLGDACLHARIDTGAKTSSIWSTNATETPQGLVVKFADKTYDIFAHTYTFEDYDRVKVSSSMGHIQVRFRVRLPVIVGGRRILATFTLADRSAQVYPVLIGRKVLMGKFIVDVAQGEPLVQEEKLRSNEIQARNAKGSL